MGNALNQDAQLWNQDQQYAGLRKVENLQRVEFQYVWTVIAKFYECWISDTKSVMKISTKSINFKELLIDQKVKKFLELVSIEKSSKTSFNLEHWERRKDYS